ncbi:TonB family protein [Spirosoma aerophilum]
MNVLDYLLKANLYGLLFVGCYWLLLRRHTFFSLNRTYLLTSVVLSLTLPLITLPAETVETLPAIPVGVMALPIATVSTAEVPVTEPGPAWEQLGLWAYGFIALALLARLSIRTGRLLRLIHQSPRQLESDYIRVLPNDETLPTFSFFNYIILNPADTRNELILRHELVHVRQQHSADVLGLGILQAVFWACPVLLLIERMLRQVHEFLADQPASQPTEYARFLVAYSFGTSPALQNADVLTNSFFTPSLLKQRIIMLHQKATNRWALGKYVLVLPLAFGLLAMTTARQELSNAVDQLTQDETITMKGKVTSLADGKPLPGVSIVIVNTRKGTTTNAKGEFTLTNVPKNASLAFSFIGFTTQVVPVGGRKTLSVSLALESKDLNEVHVVAYEPTAEPAPQKQTVPVESNQSTKADKEVFTVVEQVPEFPGGVRALYQYLTRNLRYPTEAQQNKIQGRVYVKFVVDRTGDIRELRLLKGIGGGCDEEAIRVVSQMPNWIPGKQHGKDVSVMYNLPIQFSLEKRSDDKRTGQVAPGQKLDSRQSAEAVQDNNKNGQLAFLNDMSAGRKNRYAMPLPDSIQPQTSIHVRSNGFSIGDPLYILDGIETPKEDLSKLSPDNIHDVSVLKGSSAVPYGEKGKNGVIIITTKKK